MIVLTATGAQHMQASKRFRCPLPRIIAARMSLEDVPTRAVLRTQVANTSNMPVAARAVHHCLPTLPPSLTCVCAPLRAQVANTSDMPMAARAASIHTALHCHPPYLEP